MALPARIVGRETLYAGWLRLERLLYRMPDGEVVERHLEEHGAAASVLPYNPETRTALFVSMPRAPVTQSGEPDLIEAVAGRIEDEDPQACIRREALEEAGVRLTSLEPVLVAWSLPSISTERNHLFLAPFSDADRVGEGGGAAGENEAITVHALALADAWSMLETGRITDMKTVLLLQTLRIRQPQLF